MTACDAALDRLPWEDIGQQLDAEGYAVLPSLLGIDAARGLAQRIMAPGVDRVFLEAEGLGRGELLWLEPDFPASLGQWRAAFYRRLVAIANRWNDTLGVGPTYPSELEVFLERNRAAGQIRPISHLSRLRVEDHLALHQRHDDGVVFPLQVVAPLSEPDVDFQGGDFIMVEQRPRMQSRPLVVPLALGDVAVIATAARPFRGAKGYYRVNSKHAIGRVRKGERFGLELSFHEAR